MPARETDETAASSPVREAIWLSCAAKSCCYSAFVVPSGSDVWRIARALDAPPPSFLLYFESPAPKRDAFALDGSGRRFRWVLAKNRALQEGEQFGCIFLLKTRTGHHRCGLGQLRPTGCRVFPLELVEGLVRVQAEHGCSCREWSLADVDTLTERPLLERRVQEAEAYCEVVERWNLEIERTGVARRFEEYCDYVLDAYDGLDQAVTAVGDGAAG